MSNLLGLFNNNILPIFIAAGAGYAGAKYLQLNPKSVSQVAFYIFSPCLIFDLITTSQLSSGDITRMAGFALACVLGTGALAWAVGAALRLERRVLVAVLLTVMFGNAGNYGLSLNLLAFGEPALAHASLYFVTTAILTYTVGVVVASLGSTSLKKACLGLFKVPAVYAVGLALIINSLGWQLPLPVERSVSLLAGAAIPVLIVLMGIQLQNAGWNGHPLALTVTSVLRLVAAPLFALALNLAFRLQGPAFQAGILESAMPTAVILTVLATEYDVDPSFVSTAVFTTTLLSPITITPLLAYLGA